jgi:hypothetical protein
MRSTKVNENIARHRALWESTVWGLTRALLGVIPKSVRGITLNFDGETIQITVFFETQPTERDINAMQDVEAELISHHDYLSDLVLEVVPITDSLIGRAKNWGWVYLRRED